MKKPVLSLIGFLFAFTAFSQSFEGVIKFSMKYQNTDPQTAAMLPTGQVMSIRGNQVHSLIQGGMAGIMNVETIFDAEKEEVFMVSRPQKMVIKLKNNSDKQSEEKADKIQKTEETKKIAGYQCTKYISESAEGNMVYWVTKDIKLKLPKSMLKTKDAMSNMLINAFDDGFVVASTIVTPAMTMDITLDSIEKKKLPDSLFDIPSDYNVQSFTPEQLQMMMGGH